MNGIYDFEQYRTPYLDVEMLMERKRKKQKRVLLILSGIATVLMAIIMMILLYIISKESKIVFGVTYTIFAVYIIVGALVIARFVKKGDYLWQQE